MAKFEDKEEIKNSSVRALTIFCEECGYSGPPGDSFLKSFSMCDPKKGGTALNRVICPECLAGSNLSDKEKLNIIVGKKKSVRREEEREEERQQWQAQQPIIVKEPQTEAEMWKEKYYESCRNPWSD